jgi:hypothetical protein
MSIHRNLPQLNRNVFEQWYETATSLTKIRNVLITQMQPCRSRGRRAPQLPSAKFPLRSESDLTALLTSFNCRPGSVGGAAMQDVLKQLNDRNPSDVRILDERALRRFEALCEAWAKIAEAELARRRSLPFQAPPSDARN